MSINISTTPTEGGCRVAVSGEVDVSNASALRDVLDEQLSSGKGSLAIDLAEVPYIDSTGIGVLVGAAHRAKETGRTLSVERPQRNVARVLSLLGVGADLNVTGAQQ
jgi:anti-sigma B factor antagonist